jgi:hypothetical protein
MNLKQIVIAMSILAGATGAMAVEATQWNPPAGQLSRGQAKAELAQAAATGDLQARGEAYAGYVEPRTPSAGTVARADVKQELARARTDGELEGRNEAYGGFPEVHSHAAPRAFAWRKSHASSVN